MLHKLFSAFFTLFFLTVAISCQKNIEKPDIIAYGLLQVGGEYVLVAAVGVAYAAGAADYLAAEVRQVRGVAAEGYRP